MIADPAALTSSDRLARRAAMAPGTGLLIDGQVTQAAFGGVKRSGFGRDTSLHALVGYTFLKTTWIDLA